MSVFPVVVTLPVILIYYNYSIQTSQTVAINQAVQIARKIVDSSESVYYLGKPSQTTLKVNFPEGINSINMSNKEVVIQIKTKEGLSDVVEISSINITGSLPTSKGIHFLTIKAEANYVNVTSN